MGSRKQRLPMNQHTTAQLRWIALLTVLSRLLRRRKGNELDDMGPDLRSILRRRSCPERRTNMSTEIFAKAKWVAPFCPFIIAPLACAASPPPGAGYAGDHQPGGANPPAR